jgi:glutathione peroxidase
MRRRRFFASILALLPSLFNLKAQAKTTSSSMPEDSALRLLNDSRNIKLRQLTQGKVCLMVNVASHCGFTYQYEGLEKLYQTYKDKGLIIIGFPSSDFFQEKDKEADIAQFCQLNYGVSFPMSEKIHVRGGDAHPVFKWLQDETDTSVKWNFYKFLLDRNGKLIKAFASMTEPNDKQLIAAIESLL